MKKRPTRIRTQRSCAAVLVALLVGNVAWTADVPPAKAPADTKHEVDQTLLKNCIARQGANSRVPMSQEQLAEECRKQIRGGHDAQGNPLPPPKTAPAER